SSGGAAAKNACSSSLNTAGLGRTETSRGWRRSRRPAAFFAVCLPLDWRPPSAGGDAANARRLLDIKLNYGAQARSDGQNRSSADIYFFAMPPRPSFLFAPGAGAPSTSAWMVAWRERLQALGPVETIDYPYMREGRKRPDRLPALIEAHAGALSTLRARADGPIFLAGKSMGGRVACHLALEQPVAGVICFGFPLLSTSGRRRDEVLLALRAPILLAEVGPRMTAPTTLLVVEAGDHSLAVSAAHRKASGQTQADADARVLEAVQSFVDGILVAQSRA